LYDLSFGQELSCRLNYIFVPETPK
jgi:hypothetical protein